MIVVSACLAGINCKYNGDNNKNEKVVDILKEGRAITVCPEVLGGMDIPRIPCEIIRKNNKRKVLNKKGEDYTEEFVKGAKKTLEIAKIVSADTAILKSKSPSCGFGKIYDGSFSGNLVAENGFTADLLDKNGIKVFTEKDL